MRNVVVAALVFLVSLSAIADEMRLDGGIPFGILNRVFPIQFGPNVGTSFAIDVDGRQYLITARHLMPDISDGDEIRIFKGGIWRSIKVRPIFAKNPATDIVALAPERPIVPALDILLGIGEAIVGQDVYFLGYPFGLASKSKNQHIAFVKKAIFSAIDSTADGGPIVYLDGHNNKGFSGGPIIFSNRSQDRRLQIAAVVSGYRNQPTEVEEVEVSDQESPTGQVRKKTIRFVRENTGIVIAFSLGAIEKAIRQNPIGPKVVAPAAR